MRGYNQPLRRTKAKCYTAFAGGWRPACGSAKHLSFGCDADDDIVLRTWSKLLSEVVATIDVIAGLALSVAFPYFIFQFMRDLFRFRRQVTKHAKWGVSLLISPEFAAFFQELDPAARELHRKFLASFAKSIAVSAAIAVYMWIHY